VAFSHSFEMTGLTPLNLKNTLLCSFGFLCFLSPAPRNDT